LSVGTNIARKAFVYGQSLVSRAGIMTVPNHYYAPIADVNELKRTQASWAKRGSLHGIEIDLDAQCDALRQMVAPFQAEYRGNEPFLEGQAKGYGPGFGYIEAQCLHGLLRSLKPNQVIEIGSGVSTHCTAHALAHNAAEGHMSQITCVEPYPSAYLRTLPSIDLVERKVQDVDLALFEALEEGDLLFIDTSHAVKPGGDVLFIYLEIVPRLKPGVILQIHDIYLPYLYQRDLFDTVYQWSETALLAALLMNNQRLSILFSLSMLHYDRPDVLRSVFPDYQRAEDTLGLANRSAPGHFPSSIYLQTA